MKALFAALFSCYIIICIQVTFARKHIMKPKEDIKKYMKKTDKAASYREDQNGMYECTSSKDCYIGEVCFNHKCGMDLSCKTDYDCTVMFPKYPTVKCDKGQCKKVPVPATKMTKQPVAMKMSRRKNKKGRKAKRRDQLEMESWD